LIIKNFMDGNITEENKWNSERKYTNHSSIKNIVI